MEQFFNDNMYVIDLGEVNSAPEIIFMLSSALDNEESRNKRICLKLGNVNLNQAQLLSIKSLINGIDSTLSSIETKSTETEKVALSLGIIVSNISQENATESAPAMPYKLAEELKEENQEKKEEEIQEEPTEEKIEDNNYDIVEEIQEEIVEQKEVEQTENTVQEENAENKIEETISEEKTETEPIHDELDVIFSSSPAQKTFYEMESTHHEQNEETNELNDIIVPENEYTKEDIEIETFPTKYIKQTIRSGQVINYEGNVVIIGDCHPGCEITAFGDITVWGVLSGIAHSGAGGNQKARVRALKMNAIQLRIANCYSRRPDSLNTIYTEKTNSFTPEEARIVNGEIVVFKIND